MPATPTPVATSQDNQARYILQAGAFGASGDAEAVKARIDLLGLNARVESAVIKGKTVYRVRLGPYGTATDDRKRPRMYYSNSCASSLPCSACNKTQNTTQE